MMTRKTREKQNKQFITAYQSQDKENNPIFNLRKTNSNQENFRANSKNKIYINYDQKRMDYNMEYITN